MEERSGTLYCPDGGMELSPKMREFLTQTFLTRERNWEVRPAGFRWGGQWFCPADGQRMEEQEGVVQCPGCSQVFPGPLLHQLIELHAHAC